MSPSNHHRVSHARPITSSDARVPYNRQDRRGGEGRIAFDGSIARLRGPNALGRALGLDAIGLYWVLAENGGLTASDIMVEMDIGRHKLRGAMKKLVDANLLRIESGGFGRPDKFFLLAPPHPRDDPKSIVIHSAENCASGGITAENQDLAGGFSAPSEPKITPQLAENQPANKEVIQELIQRHNQDQEQQQQRQDDAGDDTPSVFGCNENAEAAGDGVVGSGGLVGRAISKAESQSLERQLRRHLHPKLQKPKGAPNQITAQQVADLAAELLPRYDEVVIVAAFRYWQRWEMAEPMDHTSSYPVLDFRRGQRLEECLAKVADSAHDEEKLNALLEALPDHPLTLRERIMRHLEQKEVMDKEQRRIAEEAAEADRQREELINEKRIADRIEGLAEYIHNKYREIHGTDFAENDDFRLNLQPAVSDVDRGPPEWAIGQLRGLVDRFFRNPETKNTDVNKIGAFIRTRCSSV